MKCSVNGTGKHLEMMPRPSKIDSDALAERIIGTCESITSACEFLEIDDNYDWEDVLLDYNIEPCGHCEWWHYSYELEYCDKSGKGYCPHCEDQIELL